MPNVIESGHDPSNRSKSMQIIFALFLQIMHSLRIYYFGRDTRHGNDS